MSEPSESHPLTPALAETEQKLQLALEEVCDEPVVESTDTGELIRIEEGLAVASEAAKRAISLRRRIRADEGDQLPPVA